MFIYKNNEKSSRYSSYYSSKGEHATARVAQAIKQNSWHWTLLNLAWTAGPVTFIAISIGHRFGFGNGPSTPQIIYFASYTFVVGILAALAGIFHQAFYQPRIEFEKKRLLESIDSIFYLTLHIRDLNLAKLPLNERKIMAAYYTLQSAGCSPTAVKEAVYDLTSNKKLTDAIERISAFSEQGMQSLIEEAWNAHQNELREVEQNLRKIAPITFDLLIKRMKGDAPSERVGRLRDEGFIHRTLEAADENNPDHMTLSDAYEMTTLVFELINGRQIAALEAGFTGERKIARQKKRLDVARKKFRQALRKRNSSIRLVLNELNSEKLTNLLPESAKQAPVITRNLIQSLQNLPANARQNFYPAYKHIESLQKIASDAAQELLEEKQSYSKAIQQYSQKLSLALKEADLRQAGFYIKQHSIQLDDKMKILLAHRIEDIGLDDYRNEGAERVKEIAMELAAELDPLIHLGHADVETAIESSNAIQLGSLKPSYSPATKVGWARRIVQSMHENKKRASHQLAKNLIIYYEINLSDSVIKLLENEFGADPEYLKSLKDLHIKEGNLKSLTIPRLNDLPSWEDLFQRQQLNANPNANSNHI